MASPNPANVFELIKEPDEPATAPVPPKPSSQAAALSLLLLSLKALSQRALIAIDNLFMLLTVGLVFWLWQSTPDPNTYQIISLGIFATFVLAANVIVRRGK